jgi:hypothetical protein
MCRIIRVTYYLEISVVVPNGVDLSLEIPVTIGTIPLRPGPVPQAPSVQGTLPFDEPPTYAEATGGPIKIQDTDEHVVGDVYFTPLYSYVRDFQFTGGHVCVEPILHFVSSNWP